MSPSSPLPRVVAVLLVGAALTVTLAGLRSVQGIVGPAFLALVLVITVHPLRARLDRWGVPDWLGSLTVLVMTYALFLGVCAMLVVSLGRLAVLLPRYGPAVTERLEAAATALRRAGVGQEQVDAMIGALDVSRLVSLVTDLLSSVLGLLGNIFFIATLLLFVAFDASSEARVLQRVGAERPHLTAALHSFADGTRSYVLASAAFGLVVAAIDAVALWLMGVPGAFVWGVLAFVTNFVPNIGFVIGVVPPAVIALLEGGPGLMLAVITVYAAINFVVQSVIQPRVMGDRVGLAATLTFLSVVFWTWVVGPLGALLAIPLTLLLRALLVEADPSARWVLPLVAAKVDAGLPAPGAVAEEP